jgi:mono/diheme cytochrome c family protein
MKKFSLRLIAMICILGSFGCQSSISPAPMTHEVVRAGARAHVEERTLREGRALFVSRCIECHTLPVVSRYDPVAWPWLVDDMADRSSLKPAEREALVAYILAVRAQTNK